METSEQLTDLAVALIAFQAEVPAIPKASNNPFFKSKYADFADVKAVADPIANKHGLCVTQTPSNNERGDSLVTMLLHTSGQFIKDEMSLHPVKIDPQAQGSALTYGKRYAYMSVLGLVADEDDDGAKASRAKPKPPVKTDAATGEITGRSAAHAKSGLIDIFKRTTSDEQEARKLAAAVWNDAGLDGVKEITEAQWETLTAEAATRIGEGATR